jgi:hypothetical protein
MFGELPKIFDRNFVVGYVLPSALFLLLSLGFTHDADLGKLLTTSDGASFAVVAFVLGVTLLAANKTIMRILEGYGPNPARLLVPIQRWRFERTRRQLEDAETKYLSYPAGGTRPEKLRRRSELLARRLAECYPHEARLILPTSFGNCVRSFESYSTAIYKFRIIEGWTRLIAVIPKEYLDLIDTAKAQTDLWINLWFLSLVTIADALLTWTFPHAFHAGNKETMLRPLLAHLVIFTNTYGHLAFVLATDRILPYFQLLLTIVGALAVTFFSSWMGARAAIEWGSTVKASVDVFLPALSDKLGFPKPASSAEIEDRWDAFSDAIHYRIPSAMQAARWSVSPWQPATPPSTNAAIDQTAQAAPASPSPTIAATPPILTKLAQAISRAISGLKRPKESAAPPVSVASGIAPAPIQTDRNDKQASPSSDPNTSLTGKTGL